MSGHAEDGVLLAYERLRASHDALLAENQRLEHERNFLQRELGFKNTTLRENQRLREALERIEGSVREGTGGYVKYREIREAAQIAREALAGDGE